MGLLEVMPHLKCTSLLSVKTPQDLLFPASFLQFAMKGDADGAVFLLLFVKLV